jgi:L-threonylcarbamoyladenylate synthase
MVNFEDDIRECLEVLRKGGIILYPTDTIWGVGCDATNDTAVAKVFQLKRREMAKSMIVLVQDVEELKRYVQDIPEPALKLIANPPNPTTLIFENGRNVAEKVINKDGTIAIRVVADPFCIQLIKTFGKAIVSTSANISGNVAPSNFNDISDEIKNGVDYIVKHRQKDRGIRQSSTIIKFGKDGKPEILR